MKYNKDRMALLAGIDGRDAYFGKTLRENYSFGGVAEAEDDLDAAEDAEDDTPVDVEGAAEEEAPAEDMVSKEDVAAALADVLGVDAEEVTALVSSDDDEDEEAEDEDEEDEDEEDEDEEDEGGDEDLDLDLGEADEVEEAYEADEKEEDDAVNEIRRIVRNELASMIKESKQKNIENRIRAARRHKSVAVAMGYKK